MSIFNTGKSLIHKNRVIPVFLTISDDYAPYAACTIASLIKHSNTKKHYRVVILYDKLSFRNYFRLRNLVTKNCEIQFHKITHSLYLRTIVNHCAKKTGAGDFFSSAVYYYRSFIARLYPMYNKAIYIDSDTILCDDIANLYDIDLGDNIVGAVVDKKVENVPEFRHYVENALGVPYNEYVNSGVLLIDLKKMRKIRYLSKMINMINTFDANLVAPDQDYLNVICRGKILHLSDAWNAQPNGDLKKAKLVHYNLFKKPWQCDGVEGEDLFWDAAEKTGYYNDLLESKKMHSVKETRIKEAQVAALIKKADELSKLKEPIIKNL